MTILTRITVAQGTKIFQILYRIWKGQSLNPTLHQGIIVEIIATYFMMNFNIILLRNLTFPSVVISLGFSFNISRSTYRSL
jgi:hypothetical protein